MMDTQDGGSLRNLERIQESGQRDGGRGLTFGLIAISVGCVLFATIALGARKSQDKPAKRVDPLAELAARPTSSTVLAGEVTFPHLLSDRANPATALAGTYASVVPGTPVGGAYPPPPAPGDRLSVVPLPARHAVGASAPGKAASAYRDKLTILAGDAAEPLTPGVPASASGSEGGWQLQVSSFRTRAEADAFAGQLRARGHKAHVQEAKVPARGTWYRVKVGPFGSQAEALRYRTTFEAKEKMPGFVVRSGMEGAR